ncbi:acetate kinase [Pelagibaculum spongiae]|uniref:Acetate kinase n=1 Tax=Pelagibaculum spongiae TaxID=2080658 RepID=A0A2V1GUX8_9GAMM|nr:acetate kinase [Pelagibaculum spongiae]PVZ63515.1 acetate kinase [Pelagibaculum spongiae]
MKTNILILNCGSSSLKFAVIDPTSEQEFISGLAERLGSPEAVIVSKFQGEKTTINIADEAHDGAIAGVLDVLKEKGLFDTIAAVGHRVVHGGEAFTASTLVAEDVKKAISDCIPLAPLHNPANLLGIEAAEKHFPGLPQAAVFDTAFHQTMPAQAYLYPVPYEYYTDLGLRKYGFHGTSYRFITASACEMLGRKTEETALLIAHLGNGASAAAVLNGEGVDTTMGLTPLDGLMMGTRSGSVDPNIFTFLRDQKGYSLDEVASVLNKKSGLLGLSQISNDCRAVEEAAAEGSKQALLTLDVYCYVLAKQLAGLAIGLGRIDALVFTGGIGENSELIRRKVVELMGIFGFKLDNDLNLKQRFGAEGVITAESGPVAMVVSTNEELMIARDTASLIK